MAALILATGKADIEFDLFYEYSIERRTSTISLSVSPLANRGFAVLPRSVGGSGTGRLANGGGFMLRLCILSHNTDV